jgi:hypothetical protein
VVIVICGESNASANARSGDGDKAVVGDVVVVDTCEGAVVDGPEENWAHPARTITSAAETTNRRTDGRPPNGVLRLCTIMVISRALPVYHLRR